MNILSCHPALPPTACMRWCDDDDNNDDPPVVGVQVHVYPITVTAGPQYANYPVITGIFLQNNCR